MDFLLPGFAGAFLTLFSLETEYPLFVKEPPSHISAEMEKVVDIPCQARGDGDGGGGFHVICVFL